MTYEITVVNIGDWMWKGTAVIKDEEGNIVANVGPIRIACEAQEKAYYYMENTFLPDLRRNYLRQFSDLIFPWEIVEEPVDPEPEVGE